MQRRLGMGLPTRRSERPEVWGLRKEITRGNARSAMASLALSVRLGETLSQLGFISWTIGVWVLTKKLCRRLIFYIDKAT